MDVRRKLPACVLLASAVLAVLCGPTGCFQDNTIPSCVTLSDCPTGQGYTGCLDGWCYREEACGSRPAVSGDGCCAQIEGDRSADLDCLLKDVPLSCTDPAGPTIDDNGNVFVSCETIGSDGARSVAMRRYDADGILSVMTVVGAGTSAIAPVMGSGDTVFVASSDGVVRYHTGNLAVLADFQTIAPVGPMVSNRGADAPRKIVAWPDSDGRVELFDEDKSILLAYGQARSDLGRGGAMQPSVSWTGRRMYVTWNSGVLDVVEVGSNPLGPVLSMQLPALPAGPAIDVDGRIYIPLMDGRLIRYSESATTRLDEVWSLDVAQAGQQIDLLVRQDNLIVAVARSGHVNIVRDMDTFGSITASGDFGTGLDAIHPVLADSGRVVAVSADGRIVSLQSEGETATMASGLNFQVPSRPASDLILDGTSLMYVSRAGGLVSWVFPEGPSDGRWVRAAGDNGSTGRTSTPSSTGEDE